jgi:hypothetical protein
MDQMAGDGTCTQTTLIYYYHKLWKEFSTFWLWPLKAPRIDVVVKYYEWLEESQPKKSTKEDTKSGPDDDVNSNAMIAKSRPNSSDDTTKLLDNAPSYRTLNDVCDEAAEV